MSYLKAIEKPYVGELFRKSQRRAGYDIVQQDAFTFKPCILTKVVTNVKFPEGLGSYFALLTLRSSYLDSGLMIPGIGVIDSDYTDYIFYTLYNESLDEICIKKGERVVQLVFIPLEQ